MLGADDPIPKDLAPEDFDRFREWIQRHAGIYLEEQKSDALRISLVARATRHGLSGLDEYYSLLVEDEAEFKELLNLITINETSFFRFPAQFQALREHVVPEILEGKASGARTFRVWSAGCSTGEEPYSVGMTLLDFGLMSRGCGLEVLGTDVSTEALTKARHGVYAAKSVEYLPDDLVKRHFERVEGGFVVSRPVRDLVDFRYHNLIKEPYPLVLMGDWDVIFCRNVTIYFRLDSTRRVVQNLFDSLNPGGYLLIGHSETLSSISDRFEPVHTHGVFLYRKPRARRHHASEAVLPSRASEEVQTSSPSAGTTRVRAGVPAAARPGVRADTDRASTLVDESYSLISSDDIDGALAVASEAVRLSPRRPEAHLALAFSLAEAGRLEEAFSAAEDAVAADPLLAPARYILGLIHQRNGDSGCAIEEFKRTIYVDPDFVLAHFNLANIYRSQGSSGEAAREYQNALRSLDANPDGSWAHFLGGFRADLLAQTCQRGLIDCRKGARAG